MEILRRNLQRQASHSLSALAAATSPRAADQENLHPNLGSQLASPAKASSAKDRSRRPMQHPTAATPAAAVAAEDDRATAPTVDEPPVKVTWPIRSRSLSLQTHFAEGSFQMSLLGVGSDLFVMMGAVWWRAQVVVRVRPPVSLPTDGKDLFFVRKTSTDSVAVGDRAFAVDGVLDDRASQVSS
jgi:kinesin family member 15